MNNLWNSIIAVLIIITFIDIIIKISKKKTKNKTAKKKTHEKRINQTVISPEPKKLENIKWNKDFLKSLEWKRYEDVCMEYLRIKNCNANVTCTGADGGIDIKISDSSGNVFAIGQCKAWNKPIGVSLIRELYGVMAAEGVKHGIFLTTSIYSPDALEFAKNKNLLLIDGNEFINLINGLNDTDKRRIDSLAADGDYSTPTCVRCNVKMVKRVANKGNKPGKEFWGCINYPKCKCTMHVKN